MFDVFSIIQLWGLGVLAVGLEIVLIGLLIWLSASYLWGWEEINMWDNMWYKLWLLVMFLAEIGVFTGVALIALGG